MRRFFRRLATLRPTVLSKKAAIICHGRSSTVRRERRRYAFRTNLSNLRPPALPPPMSAGRRNLQPCRCHFSWSHSHLTSFILFYFILFYYVLFYISLFYFSLFYFILFYFIFFLQRVWQNAPHHPVFFWLFLVSTTFKIVWRGGGAGRH